MFSNRQRAWTPARYDEDSLLLPTRNPQPLARTREGRARQLGRGFTMLWETRLSRHSESRPRRLGAPVLLAADFA